MQGKLKLIIKMHVGTIINPVEIRRLPQVINTVVQGFRPIRRTVENAVDLIYWDSTKKNYEPQLENLPYVSCVKKIRFYHRAMVPPKA